MHKLTHESIQQLLAITETPKVTIYIPLETSAAPPSLSENQIRFKNLIHRAALELETADGPKELHKKLCEFQEKTRDDIEFWKERGKGLLIVAAGDRLEMFDLPVDTEEYMAVDDTFHLAPILALIGDDRPFYVLALAQQNPRLLLGDMYGLEEMNIGLPGTIREALGIDEANQKSENQGSATGSSLNTGWFNGRGGARNPQDNDRLKFYHHIDKLLLEKLDRDVPLLLATTDSEAAEFRDISKYPKILEQFIQGNHTESHLQELFDKAWRIVHSELVEPEHEAALEEYERLQGANPGRVARGHTAIMAAAEQGRIDKLLAMMSRQTTDTVQDNMASVFRISFPEPSSSQLLNKMALAVWSQSGKILSLLPHQMPHGDMMVARLRY